MQPFRLSLPKRRPNRKKCKHYSAYRKTLREDFNKRCGYCDDTDALRIRSFAIDHFVPRNPINLTHSIPDNDYNNLVYACSFCNGAKSNKWFTSSPNQHNDGQVGFIDPTDAEYSELFQRKKSGEICTNGKKVELAEHIIEELKLWYPVHAVTWKIEKLQELEKKTKLALKSKGFIHQNEPKWTNLKQFHYEILEKLNELYQVIFNENI